MGIRIITKETAPVPVPVPAPEDTGSTLPNLDVILETLNDNTVQLAGIGVSLVVGAAALTISVMNYMQLNKK